MVIHDGRDLSESTKGITMTKNGMKVLDSDIHVMEPEDLWDRYVEKAFRDQRPQRGPVKTEWGELDAWRFAGRVFPAYMDDPRRQRFSKVRTDKAEERHVAEGRYVKIRGRSARR